MKLSWMTDEMAKEIEKLGEIARAKDFKTLFSLEDNEDFSIALCDILSDRWAHCRDALTQEQRNLFLCMQLENFSQADGILGFLQEEFVGYEQEVVKALYAIGAKRSAEIIEEAIKLLPEDGESFFKVASEEKEARMCKLESELSNYPDGRMSALYRQYAEKYKEEVFSIEALQKVIHSFVFGEMDFVKVEHDVMKEEFRVTMSGIMRSGPNNNESGSDLSLYIDEGVLVFTGVRRVFFNPSGGMPYCFGNKHITFEETEQGLCKVTFDAYDIDRDNNCVDATFVVIAENGYLIDTKNPDVKIRE